MFLWLAWPVTQSTLAEGVNMEKGQKKRLKDHDTLSFNVPLGSDSKTYGTVTFQTKDLEKASYFPAQETDETYDIPDELEEEIQKQLDEKARKTNLTVANVKKMIKEVITSEDVINMVKSTLTGSLAEPLKFQPKLTRAKRKELEKEWNWAVPPLPRKRRSGTGDDISALIDQELPEDSSDEEYQPEESDEESRASDILGFEEELMEEIASCSSPAMSHADNKDPDSIGQRTRSKVSLNQTPLELIEQAFVPPDITTDMYNTECDNQDWLNFLKAFSKPLDSNVLNESVDDENDPEYSVTVDEVDEKPDDEEMRHDRAVKVSKKELNALLTELYEYTNMVADDEEPSNCPSGCPDDFFNSLIDGEDPASSSSPDVPNAPKWEFERFDYKAKEILKQQMNQHVQLLAQSFLLSYRHPYMDPSYSSTFKTLLEDLSKLKGSGEHSSFNADNLSSALMLIQKWEKVVERDQDLIEFLKYEWEYADARRQKRTLYFPKLPKTMMALCLKSEALVYPSLLPTSGFRPAHHNKDLSKGEYALFTIGLEEFMSLVNENPEQYKNCSLHDVVNLVKTFLVPTKSVKYLVKQIEKTEQSNEMTPLKYYLTQGKTLNMVHHLVPIEKPLKKLIDLPTKSFPKCWLMYIEKLKKK